MTACLAVLEDMFLSPKPKIIMDEVVSNIVRCSGATEFSMRVDRLDAATVEMSFSDDGKAFDPTGVSSPDITADVESRAIGGLGMFMVKKMSKSVAYRREGDKNILSVTL